jgi:hypothetical protein
MATNGALSPYLENKLINHLLRNTSYSPPSTVYAALYTVAPTETRASGEVEVSGTGYARQPVTFTVSGSYAFNDSTITFPEATTDWGTVVGVTIMDASTEGNVLFWGATTNSLVVSSGESYIINAGMLNVGLRGGTKGGWGNGIPAELLDHVLKNSAYSSPGSSVYMALGKNLAYDTTYNFTGWTEVSTSGGTGYSRKQITSWYSPTSGSTCNLSEIVFANPPIAVEWGAVTHVVIYNNSAGGNALLWGKLRSPIYIIDGDGLKFAPSDIDISIG